MELNSLSQSELMQLKTQLDKASSSLGDRKQSKSQVIHSEKTSEKPIFDFNPNAADFATLVACGIPERIARNMLKYRAKGGFFKNKESVRRVYGMNDQLFARVRPHLLIDHPRGEEKTAEEFVPKPDTVKSFRVLELNQATPAELEELNGIGPSYAKWIVEYRKRLGGFSHMEQLLEVYRIEQSTVDKIKPFIKVDPAYIETISINSDSPERLKKHPYLTYGEAEAIYNYRIQHGDFSNINELEKLYIFKGKDLNRILPYLDVN